LPNLVGLGYAAGILDVDSRISRPRLLADAVDLPSPVTWLSRKPCSGESGEELGG
jgi:hypothetical protein